VPNEEHHHHGEGRTIKHFVQDFFSNWGGYEAPLGKKLWLVAKNRTKAYSPPFRGCCGRLGEPGC